MSFLKNYLKIEKNIGIFQSIILVIFFISFFFIIFFVFSKKKKFYKKISFLPLNDKEKK